MTLSNDWRPPGQPQRRFEPRATRIPITHRDDIDIELWVGGSDTAIGDDIEMAHLRGAWLVDCAGELPRDFRAAAGAFIPRVFTDLEVVPSTYERIRTLAQEIAQAVTGDASHVDGNRHEPPERVLIFCSQGFNRSALLAGLVMRELGAEPAEVVAAIRAARPGALSNHTFVRLLLGEETEPPA